jgi:hypothetical protein
VRRVRWYLLILMFLLVPRGSSALQLRWSSGASDLSFTQARQCTLLVQAEPGAVQSVVRIPLLR